MPSLSLTQSLLHTNPERDIKQETLSATIYLQYFTKFHDEKLIDQWFKTYLPMIKDAPELELLLKVKKLKDEIIRGIPVPLRGHVWQSLVGNKLRVSSHLFHVFKDMHNGA